MYRRLHERFGTAGIVVAVIALVAALGGTALAASGTLTGKQKKEVEKIAKKYAGKPGAPGAAGANGTNGANGKDGAPGSPGSAGSPGKDGKSVALSNSAGFCGAGGISVEVEGTPASKKEICNGEPGEEGSPWTDGGTLPPGATETGSWVVTGQQGTRVTAPISLPIPMALALDEFNISIGTGRERKEQENETGEPATETAFEEKCGSSFRSVSFPVNQPTADKAGHLCVYLPNGAAVNRLEHAALDSPRGSAGLGVSGGYLDLGLAPPEEGEAESITVSGSFAVKGCGLDLPEGDPLKCP
jgi:hypothetical protein